MKSQLVRNRKAVSSVIGTIVMILVVMIGMSLLFGAIIVYSDNFQKGTGSSILEQIIVEDVFFKSSNKVDVTIFNTGKTDVVITNVYINDKIANITPDSIKIKQGAHQGEDGNILSIAPPSGTTFVHDKTYTFKIVTQRGTGFEGTYVW